MFELVDLVNLVVFQRTLVSGQGKPAQMESHIQIYFEVLFLESINSGTLSCCLWCQELTAEAVEGAELH